MTLLVIACFVGAVSPLFPAKAMIMWGSVLVGTALLRLVLYRLFMKRKKSTDAFKPWRNAFFVGALMGGGSWGWGPLLVPLEPGEPTVVIFVSTLLSVCSVASISMSTQKGAAAAFNAAALLPLAYVLWGSAGSLEILTTFVLLAGLAAMSYVGYRTTTIARELYYTREKLIEATAEVAAQEREKAVNEAKRAFISSMTHELRTPLNAVLGFAQLLGMDRNVNAKTQNAASEIMTAGESLLTLVNNFLSFDSIEAGEMNIDLQPVLLQDICNRSANFTESIAKKYEVQVHALDAPNTYVLADEARVQQALINLISNAIKYNEPNGQVWLDMDTRGEIVRLSILDNGKGIEQKKHSRLFSEFDRLGCESIVAEGAGIGLVIAKNLIEAMDGKIGFLSIPGEGSTFWIELPIATSKNSA